MGIDDCIWLPKSILWSTLYIALHAKLTHIAMWLVPSLCESTVNKKCKEEPRDIYVLWQCNERTFHYHWEIRFTLLEVILLTPLRIDWFLYIQIWTIHKIFKLGINYENTAIEDWCTAWSRHGVSTRHLSQHFQGRTSLKKCMLLCTFWSSRTWNETIV